MRQFRSELPHTAVYSRETAIRLLIEQLAGLSYTFKRALNLLRGVEGFIGKAFEHADNLIVGATLLGHLDEIVFADRVLNCAEHLVYHLWIKVHTIFSFLSPVPDVLFVHLFRLSHKIYRLYILVALMRFFAPAIYD